MAKIAPLNWYECIGLMRRRKGFTVSALAKATGLHRNYIAQLESGDANPTLDTLGKVCTALD